MYGWTWALGSDKIVWWMSSAARERSRVARLFPTGNAPWPHWSRGLLKEHVGNSWTSIWQDVVTQDRAMQRVFVIIMTMDFSGQHPLQTGDHKPTTCTKTFWFFLLSFSGHGTDGTSMCDIHSAKAREEEDPQKQYIKWTKKKGIKRIIVGQWGKRKDEKKRNPERKIFHQIIAIQKNQY